jgi:16S rRNA U1498 N3-methylase RsmE
VANNQLRLYRYWIVLDILRDNENVIFVVRPEGGWSPEEEALFDEIRKQDGMDSSINCCFCCIL